MDTMLGFLEGDERELHLARAAELSRPAPDVRARLLDSEWGRRSVKIAGLRGDGDALLASLVIRDLRWRLGAVRLHLAGLAELVVRRDLRGLGLGRSLVERVHDWLFLQGYQGVVVVSTIGAAYWSRLGYEELPQAAFVAELAPARDPGDPATGVRAFRDADFAAVREIYNTESSLQRLAVLRGGSDWSRILLEARLEAAVQRFLVAEDGGRVTAYLRARSDAARERLEVLEYGFVPGARARLAALVHRLLSDLGPALPPRLQGVVPSRFQNLFPGSGGWVVERERVLCMKTFGGFQPPVDILPDERLIWQSDWF